MKKRNGKSKSTRDRSQASSAPPSGLRQLAERGADQPGAGERRADARRAGEHGADELRAPLSATRPVSSASTASPSESRRASELCWAPPAAAAAAKCQQIYLAARSADASGRIHLDTARLAQALAEAGIGPLAEQELYSLSLLAAADGHSTLFEEDVLAAIAKAS